MCHITYIYIKIRNYILEGCFIYNYVIFGFRIDHLIYVPYKIRFLKSWEKS